MTHYLCRYFEHELVCEKKKILLMHHIISIYCLSFPVCFLFLSPRGNATFLNAVQFYSLMCWSNDAHQFWFVAWRVDTWWGIMWEDRVCVGVVWYCTCSPRMVALCVCVCVSEWEVYSFTIIPSSLIITSSGPTGLQESPFYGVDFY